MILSLFGFAIVTISLFMKGIEGLIVWATGSIILALALVVRELKS